uniref:Uncharacterized protein n=1 Tax=Arundo donax TaxID=35708 RepID=A0A0A8Y3W2_ARUDO
MKGCIACLFMSICQMDPLQISSSNQMHYPVGATGL